MTRTQLILLGCLPGPHQIAQRLRPFVWNPHRRQIAGSVTARQPLGIPPIRLYPVASLHRNQCRRNYLARDSKLRQLPVEYVAGWTSLVAGLQMLNRPQLLHQLADRLRTVGYRSQAAYLAIRLGYCNGYRLGMHIQTQKSYLCLHDRFLSACGSELCFFQNHSLIHGQRIGPVTPSRLIEYDIESS